MSNHLFRIWGTAIHILCKPTVHLSNAVFNLFGLGVATGVHAIYAYSTKQEEEIQVVNKYKMNRHGFTDFMMVDGKGRHLIVNNSFWYWKWDSVEEWSRIQKGDTIRVRMYGWREPLLGLFPIVVRTKKVEQKREPTLQVKGTDPSGKGKSSI